MEYAAIPTMFDGVQMRSRLEARWAAVFELMGRKWQYEPFDLNGWIPDFMWEVDDALTPRPLFEVKPISRVQHPNGPPLDVTDKIESALSIVRGRHEGRIYDPFILGSDVLSVWRFNGAGNDTWTPIDIPFHPSWWKQAGNATQWKAPR